MNPIIVIAIIIIWLYILSVTKRAKLHAWSFMWGSLGLFVIMMMTVQPLLTMPLARCVAAMAGIVGDVTGAFTAADKPNSFRRLLTDNNAFWLLQHHTQQSTNPGRSGTDNQNSIFLGNFRDACCPKTCCKHITDKQSLFITHCIRNTVQTLIRIRNSDIFRLTAINSAT